jgi:DNA-binding beta-propeller fold protein YncE
MYDDEANRLNYPNALAYDRSLDEIYVVNGGSLRVVVYGPDFFTRYSIGAGRGVLSPSGVAVMDNGEVYVCQVRTRLNPSPRITILNAAFFVDREIFLDEIQEAAGFIPRRVAVNRDGLIYLAGLNTRGVMVLDNEGNFLRWIQPVGLINPRNALKEGENPSRYKDLPTEEGQLVAEEIEDAPPENSPYADIPEEYRPRSSDTEELGALAKVESPVLINFVTIDSTGKLYLLSNELGKIFVYGPDEELLFEFGVKGGSPGQLSQPRALTIDEEQELIYVADYTRHTIVIYNLSGEYLFEVGGRGTDPGWYNYPTGMAINNNRQFIVADLFNGRVQVLELGYDEWKNAYVLEPPTESGQDDGEAGAEEISVQDGSKPLASDAKSDQTNQQDPAQERPEGDLGILIELESPTSQPEVKSDLDHGQEFQQEQPETVPEVIFEKEQLPAYPESKNN